MFKTVDDAGAITYNVFGEHYVYFDFTELFELLIWALRVTFTRNTLKRHVYKVQK
jgi:hypothetical protein